MATASDVMAVAAAEVGYSRWADPEPGTKYGRWYEANVDRNAANYDFGASGVPYCAMFVSWVLDQCRVACRGFPGAYCPAIHGSQHLSAAELRAGDVVLFDWEDDGTDDHVGLVEANYPAQGVLHTIEGNTGSGQVLRRTRSYSQVCGGIRPDYGGQAPAPSAANQDKEGEKVYGFALVKPGSKGAAVSLCQAALNIRAGAGLAVDGEYGPKTKAAIAAWQRRRGLDADGECGPKTWPTLLLV